MARYSARQVVRMLDVVSSIHDYHHDLEMIDKILDEQRRFPARFRNNSDKQGQLRFARVNRDPILEDLRLACQAYVAFPEEIRDNIPEPFDIALLEMKYDIAVY